MSRYVATYDITRDSSRRAVARILLGYGARVQWSVFEIDLEPEEIDVLKRNVGPWLAVSDQFDLYPIDRRHDHGRVRWQKLPYPDNVQLF